MINPSWITQDSRIYLARYVEAEQPWLQFKWLQNLGHTIRVQKADKVAAASDWYMDRNVTKRY